MMVETNLFLLACCGMVFCREATTVSDVRSEYLGAVRGTYPECPQSTHCSRPEVVLMVIPFALNDQLYWH